MVGDHLLGEQQVGLQKGLSRGFHRLTRRTAHLGDSDDQVVELLMECIPHASSLGAKVPVEGRRLALTPTSFVRRDMVTNAMI
ncbi:hypothetical protein MGALJ_02140 [Mycobacterium gallinarum]|uniref:Uncharacterized protein n=1 Tax=Mycobacterium gallinarum TaxID=39689 RepID=A0A9W4B3Z1_9MYCO|nr:hypothetical protein MGALJ_02140 [Mycobacterium gallinarum]